MKKLYFIISLIISFVIDGIVLYNVVDEHSKVNWGMLPFVLAIIYFGVLVFGYLICYFILGFDPLHIDEQRAYHKSYVKELYDKKQSAILDKQIEDEWCAQLEKNSK